MTVVDTSAWYAFFVKKDEFYSDSVSFLKTKPRLFTSHIVFEEVLALLHHRQGKRIALLASDTIPQMSLDGIHYVTKEEDEEILALYKKTSKQIDYVDASVAYFAKKFDAPVFSFDRHFKTLNVTLVP